jgi:hypothetical protein
MHQGIHLPQIGIYKGARLFHLFKQAREHLSRPDLRQIPRKPRHVFNRK